MPVGIGCDEEVFADGKVNHIGQLIGIIVAESQPLAQRAAKAVKVTYEDLPSVITIEVCHSNISQRNNNLRTTCTLCFNRMQLRQIHFIQLSVRLKMVMWSWH